MLDWQRHEDELANARIAEDAVRSGRRTRRRRLVMTVAVLGALAVAGPLVVSFSPSAPSTVVVGAGTPAVPVARTSAARVVDTSDRTQLYVLVLAGPRPGGTRTLVPERLCVGASQRPVLPCHGPTIPERVQTAVKRAVPSVRFVAAASWPRRPDQPGVVGFGSLVVRGDRASLETESMCGSLCGSGERRTFIRHDGRWVTSANVRGGWIS